MHCCAVRCLGWPGRTGEVERRRTSGAGHHHTKLDYLSRTYHGVRSGAGKLAAPPWCSLLRSHQLLGSSDGPEARLVLTVHRQTDPYRLMLSTSSGQRDEVIGAPGRSAASVRLPS